MEALLRELLECLEHEQTALVAGAADDLERVGERKAALLERLNAAVISRRLGSGGRDLVTELARINALNGTLVAQRHAYTKARFDALTSAAEAALYGARGNLRSAGGPRTSTSA